MTTTRGASGWGAFCRWAIPLAGLLPLATGCGSPAIPTGRVHGRVTYADAPVCEGVVSLYSAELGSGASGAIGNDGTYTISEPVRTGKYTVVVLPPPEPPPQDAVPVARSKTYPKIPLKYRDPKKSGLSVEVKEGDNPFDVQMAKS